MTGPLLLGVVGILLTYYLIQCFRLRSDAGNDLTALGRLFTNDIEDRAVRGQNPDWKRYSDEGDRQHEVMSEAMRNYATTALATGVGGTMAMLFLHFSAGSSGSTDTRLAELFDAMSFALLASGFGVTSNLIILLFVLPSADIRFERMRAEFVRDLHHISVEHPPENITARLTTILGERLDAALRATAQDSSDAIRTLHHSVASLSSVATTFQDGTSTLSSAGSSISDSVTKLEALTIGLCKETMSVHKAWMAGLDTWQTKFHVVASGISESVGRLGNLPVEFGTELSKVREGWASDIAEAQTAQVVELKNMIDAHASDVRQMLGVLEAWNSNLASADEQRQAQRVDEQIAHERALRYLTDSTSDIVDAVRELPTNFERGIQNSSQMLGKEFGIQAHQQVADLNTALRQHGRDLDETLGKHVGRMTDEMANMVYQGLKPTLEPTLEAIARIGDNLETLGKDVRHTIGEFADNGQTVRDSLVGVATTIDSSASQLMEVHKVAENSLAIIQKRHEVMHTQVSETFRKIELLLRPRPSRLRRLVTWMAARRWTIGNPVNKKT